MKEQARIGPCRPEQPAQGAGFIVGGRRELDLAIPSEPHGFRVVAVTERGKSGKRHVVPLHRQLAREHGAILTDGAEVRRQPVADIEEPAAVFRDFHVNNYGSERGAVVSKYVAAQAFILRSLLLSKTLLGSIRRFPIVREWRLERIPRGGLTTEQPLNLRFRVRSSTAEPFKLRDNFDQRETPIFLLADLPSEPPCILRMLQALLLQA